MKKALLLFGLLFAIAASALMGADSGGVTTGTQTWDGLKIFLREGVRDATLTGADTLTLDSYKFQRLDGGGSHRNVTLPAAKVGLWFFIWNVGTTNDLVMKDADANTIVTINEGKVGWVAVTSAGAWKGVEFGAAFSGGLLADGSVVGATGAAQDFGANGIKADNIISSTATTTNFNLKLTDNLADALNIKEASTSYLKFVTTNSGEKIQLGKDLDIPAAQSFTVLDNSSTALSIKEASNVYMTFDTTNSGEKITIGKKVDLGTQVVERTSQRYRYTGGWKVGGTAGFVVAAADNIFAATCPASTTGAKLIVPLNDLKVGSTITAFGLLGQIESAGNNVTVDCDLRKSTAAAGDFTDASASTMTQISVTADTKVDSTQDKTGVSITVAQDEMYYMVITVTTNAATDVDIRGVTVVVTEQ